MAAREKQERMIREIALQLVTGTASRLGDDIIYDILAENNLTEDKAQAFLDRHEAAIQRAQSELEQWVQSGTVGGQTV